MFTDAQFYPKGQDCGDYIEYNTTELSAYNIISLATYDEFRKRNIDTVYSLNELEAYIELAQTNSKTCVEVLQSDILRIYLDMENIPSENTELYKQIIADFMEYAGLNKTQTEYVITFNPGSHHKGLSYHVIFHVLTTLGNLKNLVQNFKSHYKAYASYVDDSVYTRLRLFRLPGQRGLPCKDEKYVTNPNYDITKDIHQIYETHFTDPNHKYTLKDCVIQHTLPDENKAFTRQYKKCEDKDIVKTPEENKSGDWPDDNSFFKSTYRFFVNIFKSFF
jgi:hypothetical protein